MKDIKVKRNQNKELADSEVLGYTNGDIPYKNMQYKIPIQIENEDTIVAGLSIRQLIIMMVWWGAAYGIFQSLEPKVWPEVALIPAVIIAVIGIIIALIKISEMTFLPAILSFFRLALNSKLRTWSIGTDSYDDLEIGYVTMPRDTTEHKSNKTLESKMNNEATENILKL